MLYFVPVMEKSLQSVPRLKELRERRGLTQEELAILSGVPRRTIARHEVEPDTRLRRDARLKLAKALKVKPDELADVSGVRPVDRFKKGR